MNTLENYINSGILEMYVMGMTTKEETEEIQHLYDTNIFVKNEIDEIAAALDILTSSIQADINPSVKPMIMSTIHFTERLKNGEEVIMAPLLNESSQINDYKMWIERDDMQDYNREDEIDAKVISASPEATTMIVWLKKGAPIEVHDSEMEHFLILEGTCTITIGEETHHLVPGNYLSIPLYVDHSVKVTSKTPCKVILQRVAA